MKLRFISLVLFLVYIVILFKVMVLKDVPLVRVGFLKLNFGGTREAAANFIPFKTIWPYLLGDKGLIIAGINIIGNIVLLVPIGFLAPLVYRGMTWKRTLFLAVASGLAIEGMQVWGHVGIFDIDDVILNGVGVLAGYWAFILSLRVLQRVGTAPLILSASVLVAASVLYFGVYRYQHHQFPIGFEPAPGGGSAAQANHPAKGSPNDCKSCDPCRGTGGLGPIISMENDALTIKRKDGVIQTIKLTPQTTIKTAAGPATAADLRVGDRVTIVTGSSPDSGMTAVLVLICNLSPTEPAR